MASVATTLNGAVDDNDLAFVVRDALGFPSSGSYKGWVDSEAFTVTAGAGTTTWTVTRGSEGTTAAAHLDGAAVYLYPEAYATVDEVLETFDNPPEDADKLARIRTLLEEVSDELDMEVGRDFYRHPRVSGTETRTIHGSGTGRICIHQGVVSITSLEVAESVGGTYTTIASGDYFLETLYSQPGHPYDHLTLSTAGAIRTTYPRLQRIVRITGVFGFEEPPAPVKAAVKDRVRQRYAADPSVLGGVIGPEEGGRPVMLGNFPHTFYRVKEKYGADRTFCSL